MNIQRNIYKGDWVKDTMKKEMKRVFVFALLGMFLLSLSLGDVAGAETETFLSDNVLEPVKGFVNEYIIPENYFGSEMNNTWFVISLLGMLIFYLIIYEIITTVSPLSTLINVLIVIFVILALTLFGIVRTIVGGLMVWIIVLTGAGGMFGMFMLGVIFIVGAIAIFTGSSFLHKWIAKIKYNKALQQKVSSSTKKATDINALSNMAGKVSNFKS